MSPFDQVQAAFGPSLSSTNQRTIFLDPIVESVSPVHVVIGFLPYGSGEKEMGVNEVLHEHTQLVESRGSTNSAQEIWATRHTTLFESLTFGDEISRVGISTWPIVLPSYGRSSPEESSGAPCDVCCTSSCLYFANDCAFWPMT